LNYHSPHTSTLDEHYISDVVETVTSETKTWVKFRDETETLS